MRYLKLTLIILLLGLALFRFDSPVVHADGQTKAQAQKCHDDWDGSLFDPGSQKEKNWKKLDPPCWNDAKPAGNCTLGRINNVVDPDTGQRIPMDKVSCTDPNGDPSGNGNGNGNGNGSTQTIPNVTDPALNFDKAQCEDADHCNLIKKYVNPIIAFMGAAVGLAVVIGVVWGAIQYSTSGGDPQKVAAAKDHITKSLVAFVVFLFLFALLQWLIPGGVLQT